MRAALTTFVATSVCWGQCMLEIPPEGDGRWFANSVSASGGYIAIGNPGPRGSESSVLIYREVSGRWELMQEVKPTDPEVRRSFGWSCDLDGDRLVVGAPADDELGPSVGSAYVFERRGSLWEQTARLLPQSPYDLHRFGLRSAIAGDLMVVNGDIFRFNGGKWSFEQRLWPPWPSDVFATDGQRILVGAERGGEGRGAAVVYAFDGSAWYEEAILESDPHGIRFGAAVAIDGDRLLIGAPWDEERVRLGGAAHLYEHDGSGWRHAQKLVTHEPVGCDLGTAVAFADDRIVLSAPFDGGHGTGFSGSLRIFEFSGAEWVQTLTIRRSPEIPDWSFGTDIAHSRGYVAVGAPEAVVQWPHMPFTGPGVGYVFDLFACDCPADLDRDGELTFFDFLEFQSLFAAGDLRADFDGSGSLDFFDFLAFQDAFVAGCS